ncbi:MAG: hypothetical protein ACI9U2_002103 [Bradymonadia bacterium]|jgi:uncharacterized protein YqjF (DUF2071 family)
MDRLSPTHRPEGRAQGSQSWRELLFLHWPVPVEALRAIIPEPLSIDTHDGVAWIGIVPFEMQAVRPWWWVPRFAAFEFLECNLRTYVHLDGKDPGVWFFSLEAASRLAVWAARVGWSLPYHFADMHTTRADGLIDYRTERRSDGAMLECRYRPTIELGASAPDTLEFFLFERYLLYSARRGALKLGQVHHKPYPTWEAELESCTQTLTAAAGLSSLGDAALCHYSPGVDVEIFPLKATGRRVG